MQCFRPIPAEKKDLLKFHSSDYLNFLQTVTTENQVAVHLKLTVMHTSPS